MKLTDEQYRQIGRDVVNEMLPHLPKGITWVHEYRGDEKAALLAAGLAAMTAVAPLLLAEPTDDEMIVANIDGGTPWKSSETGKVLLNRLHYRAAFANRLASVTAKPDPAVEAVKAALRGMSVRSSMPNYDHDVAEIVAAVDKARASRATQTCCSSLRTHD